MLQKKGRRWIQGKCTLLRHVNEQVSNFAVSSVVLEREIVTMTTNARMVSHAEKIIVTILQPALLMTAALFGHVNI